MTREEFEVNYHEILNSADDCGIDMIWNPSEFRLMVDNKIINILENYDVKNETLEQFIHFVDEEDRDNIFNFFMQNFEESYIENKQIKQRYRIRDVNGLLIESVIFGRIIKNDDKYYLAVASYFFEQYKNNYKDMDLLMESFLESIHNRTMNSIFLCDRITGLPNRYLFKNLVTNLLRRVAKRNTRAAMVIIDVDNFKYVNDSFGHDFGDILLKKVSSNILELVGEETLVCRYSGNTFILFKPNVTDIEEVVILCDTISKSFEKPNIIDEKKIYLTASIGVSLTPEHGIDYNTLLKNADVAMYEAKKNGKNECDFFDQNISIELNRVYSLQKGLRTALQNNEIYVVFQPKISLDNSIVSGFEALARWNSKEFGVVSPSEFIPIAESTKMIMQIGSFVLEEVFRKTKYLLNEGNDNFKIAVNLSEMQLREDVVLSDFKKLIKKYRIHPKYIEVEITESMLMKSFDKNLKILEEFKNLGVSIALDDFGTGYSSLNYLTKLPIDVLKIDRSFVTDLMNNMKSKCIVENIIDLSHKLGIEVVAEGVEDKSQVEYLREIFCDVVQGYYFSKPKMFNQIKNIIGKKVS